MSLVPIRRAGDGLDVYPAATIAGTPRFLDADADAGTARSPLHRAATGEAAGWQEHANAALIDAAVGAARAALAGGRAPPGAPRGGV
ncbi:MAG: aldehyde dehydrogenase, partial [Burkholderia sp.]